MDSDSSMELLKSIKKSRGWTSYRLAAELGISPTQLAHYEKLPISTRELMLVKLQEVSGLSLDQFWEKLCSEVESERKKRVKKKIDDLKNS